MNITSTSERSLENRRFGFWGNLPFSRKLLLAFGALFVSGLVIAASGLFGLNRVQGAYEDTLAGGVEIQNQSNNLSISLLEARRREKDFLLRWQTEGFDVAYESYVRVNQGHTANMKATLKELDSLASVLGRASLAEYSQAQYEADIDTLNQDVVTYEQAFASAVSLLEQRGYVDTGLEGEFRIAVQTIEAKIIDREGLDKLVITMLNIRRREKDYLLRGDQQYVDNVHELVIQLKDQVTTFELLEFSEKTEIKALADDYQVKFDALVAKDQEVAAAIEVFRAAAADIQTITARLETAGEQLAVQDVQTAQANSIQTFTLTGITVLIVLIVSIVLAVALSRQLTRSIISLKNTAQKISAGKFDAQADVNSADEIGELAVSFNTMSAQLKNTLDGLEQRVAERTRNLELAAEVGRTVSQVRALEVMLKDAAELIRKQFDLYYVQVYLTDPSQTNLLLQSGTGAVGTELMGRGHRLPLNTASINGRAAVEKQAVVISDTSASASFRPNPLLPNTRSEMAVPLLIGEKVVGVLDMQSEQAGSLSQEILPAFEALAGQLAIAIQNATLLAETEQARAEVEAQARRLVRANWADYLDAIHKPEETGFVFEKNKISVLTQQDEANKENSLVAPISVTGETLGNLVVEMSEQSQGIRTAELVNTIAAQVAQHIESLRLLESAERYRAEAEAASHRITRAGWKDHVANTNENISYFYNLKEVLPYKDNGSQLAEGTVNLPLKVRDETIGKLSFQGISSDDQDSIELANAVAERLGAHIENLRLLSDAQHRTLDLEEAQTLLDSVVENLPTMLFVKDAEELRFVRWNKAAEEITGFERESLLSKNDYDFFPTEEADSFTFNDRQVLVSGQTLDIPEEPLATAHKGIRYLHTRKVPIFGADGKAKYLLGVSEDITERKHTEETINKRAKELAAVAEISTVSSQELDIHKMLESVVHLSQRRFGLYHAHIFIFNETTASLEIAACGWQAGDENEGTHETVAIPLSKEQSLVARAARTRQSVIVNNVKSEPGWLANLLLPDTASEMAVPLVVGDQVLGVLDIQSNIINAFTEEDANIQTTLASQVATALQNARSFARAQQQANRESTLNVISQKIQSATSVEAVLQIAARELGHALGAPMTVAQLSMKDKS